MTFQPGKSGNPKGRPRKQQIERSDGWQNVMTGLGTSRDKRMGSSWNVDITDDASARDLWLGNDIAARVIETIPQEALRAGYDIRIQPEDEEGSDKEKILEMEEAMQDLNEDLGIEQLIEQAWKYERAYGGSAILPIVNDGSSDLTQPLDLDRIISLSHFVLLEPRECIPFTWQGDITLPNFGEPEIYNVQPITRGQIPISLIQVHHSRLIIMRGIRTSRVNMNVSRPASWGGSVLQRCVEIIMDYQTACASAAALMQDSSQGVYKLAGLSKLMAANEERLVSKQLNLMDTMRSALRMVVIDAEDDFERKATPFAGIPDVLAKLESRLAAAADMPVTLLMGTSPGGLNATGDSDRAFFYDRVARLQRIKLRPILEQIQRLIFRSKMIGPEKDESPTNGVEPDVWSVQFRPLWQPSQQEEVAARKLLADADAEYIDRGVLMPEEVAASRFGGDDYSYATTIDLESRQKMAETRQAQDLIPSTPGAQTQEEKDQEQKNQEAKTAAMAQGKQADNKDKPKE